MICLYWSHRLASKRSVKFQLNVACQCIKSYGRNDSLWLSQNIKHFCPQSTYAQSVKSNGRTDLPIWYPAVRGRKILNKRSFVMNLASDNPVTLVRRSGNAPLTHRGS